MMKRPILLTIALSLALISAASGQTVPGSFLVTEGMKKIDGVRLYYKTFGNGEPILVIHGGPGLDHSYLLPHLGRLSSSYKLILFDHRGSGRSTIPKDTAAMALGRFVDDIEGIRKAFGLEQMHLLAHSWGAMLALRYAIKYPGHLKSLILVTPVAASSTYFHQGAEALARRVTRSDSIAIAKLERTDRFKRHTAGALEQLFRLYVPAMLYSRNDAGKLRLNFPRDYWKRNSMLVHLGSEAVRFDLYPELESLKVPTLIVATRVDATPKEALERMRDSISGAQLVTIEKSGHFPFMEQPEEFFSVVLRFLQEASQVPSR